MKRAPCPRCQGTGTIDEDETLIGLSPFQDRPSAVNDDEWAAPEEHGEPTRVQDVPSFKMPPKPMKEPIASPKLPPDLTRIATDSERPTRIIHDREELLPKRRAWLPALVAIAVALGVCLEWSHGWVHLRTILSHFGR